MASLSKRLGWALQQVVPPALLTYFAACWRICAFEIGPELIGRKYGLRRLGAVYSIFATASIASMVSLYLRLYFLSRSQSVPPREPPAELLTGSAIYECLSPAEVEAVTAAQSSTTSRDDDRIDRAATAQCKYGSVNRCYLQRCNGRWKPARARHCSTCGTCRMGFDHHCAVFANCLTVAHVPTFLCMVVLVPPVIFILSSPLLIPLAKRGVQAWRVACNDPDVKRWWEWTPSWIVAGGPVGRWIGGLVLGWRQLDRLDGGGAVRVSVAALVGVGGLVSAICLGLAYTAISLIRSGRFTIDRERARMHSRSVEALQTLEKRCQAIPDSLRRDIEKWAEKRWFSVPTPDGGRIVLPTLAHEQAYDLGSQNWRFVVCSTYGWLLPWRALSLGLREQDMMSWPINPEVEKRLRHAAAEACAAGDFIDT